MHRKSIYFKIMRIISFALVIFSINLTKADELNLQTAKLTDGLSLPWGLAQIPNTDFLLITQKSGQLIKLNLLNNEFTSIAGLPEIEAFGQGGLLDIAIAPNFSDQNWIYFSYAKKISNSTAATTLARARLDNNMLVQWQDLLVTKSASSNGRHFGSRITFDEAGHVFFSVGDRGQRENSQNLQNHAGSIIRLNLDGTIPPDNPFVNNNNALAEIYSYGHRNPQGLFYDTERDILISNEHGPRGGDEINIIQKGMNYGWPVVSLGKEYWGPVDIGVAQKEGMKEPIYYFTPSIAPSSLIVYQGNKLAQLKGNLLSGALVLQHLNRITIDNNMKIVSEQRYFQDQGRIRDVLELESGDIVYITDSGHLFKITSTSQ